MTQLRVWMNGLEVATWEQGTTSPARLTCTESWLASPRPRPVSLSLPLLPAGQSHRGDAVTDYFDNILPDNAAIRTRIRDRFSTRPLERLNCCRQLDATV